MKDYIVVLNDGETFTTVSGCTIHAIPENVETEDLEQLLKENKLPKIAEMDVWGGDVSIETWGQIKVNGKIVGSGN